MYRQATAKVDHYLKCLLIFLIKTYQIVFSPFLGANCRFYPSCSSYAKEAVQRFGSFKGILLVIGRLLRCHPFCSGGVDEVPQCDKQLLELKKKQGLKF